MSSLPPRLDSADAVGRGRGKLFEGKSVLGDRFRFVRELGRGALARVELLRDPSTNELWAAKFVPEAEEARLGVLRREYRLRSRVAHAQVPRPVALGSGVDSSGQQGPVLVTEYAPGVDLRAALEGAPTETALLFLAQALSVVSWLHQCGVVHGDLKPENLCIDPEAQRPLVRLLDFGTALDLAAGEQEWIGGTPAYVSPALKAGAAPGPASDLFALGRSFRDSLRSEGTGSNRGGSKALEVLLGRVLDRLEQADEDLAYGRADDALVEVLEGLWSAGIECKPGEQLPLPRQGVFVDREEELERLAAKRAALSAGILERNLVVVEGQEGVGKSRLLEQIQEDSVLAGLEVRTVRCSASSGPLGPILEVFASLFPEEYPARVRLARAVARATPSSIPVQGSSPVTEPFPEEGEADVLQPLSSGVLRDLARDLRDEASRRPLCIAIDDAHRADEATLRFLRILGRDSAQRGPLVVVAGREEEGGVPNTSPWAQRIGDSAAREIAHLCLAPLKEAVVERVVRAAVPSRLLNAGEAQDAARLGSGNPRSALEYAQATLEGLADTADPRTLLLERRLARRTGEEHSILVALAVVQRPVPSELITQVVEEDLECSAELPKKLEALCALQLISRESSSGSLRYRIHAEPLAAHLRAGLSPDVRRRLHRRALDAWSRWPVHVDRPIDMLAHHAAEAGDREAAVRLGLLAVRHAMQHGQLASAEATIREVLALGEASEEGQGPEGWQAELTACLAELCHRTGRGDEAQAAATAYGDPGDPAAVYAASVRSKLLGVLGSVAESRGELGEAEACLTKALEASGELFRENAEQLSIRCKLAERLGAVRYRSGDFPGARRAWEDGLSICRPSDQSTAIAELHNDLGVLELDEGDHSKALERHGTALEVRRSLGDLEGVSRSLSNLALVAHARGDLGEAIDLHEESLRTKRLLGTVPTLARSLRNLGVLYRHRGEYARAIECLEESIALRASAKEALGVAGTRRVLALLLHSKGELGPARAHLEQARATFADLGVAGVEEANLCQVEARLALDGGDAERALERARAGLGLLGDADHRAARISLMDAEGKAHLLAGRQQAGRMRLAEARELALSTKDAWQVGWSRLEHARALFACPEVTEESAQEELSLATRVARELEAPELLAETLLSSYDQSRSPDGQGPSEAGVNALLEAEHLAVRLGLPRLEIRASCRMGEQAERGGLVYRAVHWWRRGLLLLDEELQRREPSEEKLVLALPEHRRLIGHLARVLSVDQAGRVLERADLVALLRKAETFEPEGASGSDEDAGGALRPEILRRLLEISRAANAMRHREEILAYLRERLAELFGAENSQIVLLGGDGSFHLMGESAEASQGAISKTVLDRVLAEEKPLLVRDTRHDLELQAVESVHRLGLASVLCAPLIVDGKAIGVIQFDHRHHPCPFREEDLVVLELFAHQAATALKNILLVEQLDETIERARLSDAQLVAGERMRALGQMAAGVAHDFNNHLTIVLGITDLMKHEPGLSAAMSKDVEMLETVALTAAETVQRLQDFRGEPRRRATRIDVAQVIRQAAELGQRRFVSSRSPEQGVEISAEAGASDLFVLGTEGELREVLLNLLINGVQAMPDGGRVLLRARAEGERVILEVLDEGPGVSAELAQRIFEPFYSTKKSGQGMGLAISWGIVRRMGGTVEVTGRPDGVPGACFTLSFPAAPEGASEASEEEAFLGLTTQAEEARWRDLRVLVVDDDPVVREIICRLLAAARFRPKGVSDSGHAIRLFEEEHFDLVLTDYSMPGLSGLEVAHAVRKRAPDCPVVLLTGAIPELEEERAVEEDDAVAIVLRKPITSRKLAVALSNVL